MRDLKQHNIVEIKDEVEIENYEEDDIGVVVQKQWIRKLYTLGIFSKMYDETEWRRQLMQ